MCASPAALLLLLCALLYAAAAAGQTLPAADCREWTDCRRLALAAAEAGEHEIFHDLAWRTVQTGPPRDPALMHLLARAQSLSGRPQDALVMLRRLADMGVVTDAAHDDDFRRVRALAGWPDVEARVEALRVAGADLMAHHPVEAPAAEMEPAEPAPAAPASATIPPDTRMEEAVRFATGRFAPGALAYDAVSRRFLVTNPEARRVMVVGEGGSSEPVVMVRSESGGFEEVLGIEIDAHRGDLWIASAAGASAGAGSLHKLQLISGRPLAVYEPPAAERPVDLADIAVTRGGTALALDRSKGRLFAARPRGRTLAPLLALDVPDARSLAPAADEGLIYVAHAAGVVLVNLRARTVSPLGGEELGGFERIRWHRGSLVGVQSRPDGSRRLVRVRLHRGGLTAVALEVLDPAVPPGSGATLSGDDLYYLAGGEGARDAVIRRIRLH
jgi:hypothetical protein